MARVTNQDALPERVDVIERKLDTLSSSVDKRFDAVDKRFDALSSSVDRRFDDVDKRFNEVRDAFVEQRQYTEFGFERLERQMTAGFQRIERKLDRLLDSIA